MNSQKSLMILSVLAVLVVITTACFITNCPPGGKRSLNIESPKKQCTRCGPAGSGSCFGPNICCGSSFGCQINNRFTAVCSTEDNTPHPCYNEGKQCGRQGICASDSICCTSDGCFTDKRCQLKASSLWSSYDLNSL